MASLAEMRSLLALVETAKRAAPLEGQPRHVRGSAAACDDMIEGEQEQHLDALERQLLEKAREFESLSQRHDAMSRRLELQSSRLVAEIERLRAQLDALRTTPERSGMPAQRAKSVHRRFTQHHAHPLVDDALDIANTISQSPEFSMDAPLFARTNFQPTFKPKQDAVYDVVEFLALHDRSFVRAAYVAILRREPDPEGAENYVGLVRAGEPKARLLKEFLNSEEGRRHHTEIRGLDTHLRMLRLCELPLVGRWIAAVLFLANVNGHLRDLRVLENHVIRIAEESQAVHEANLSKLRSISK